MATTTKKASNAPDPRTGIYIGKAKQPLQELADALGQTQSAVVRLLVLQEHRRFFRDDDAKE